jgi:hypothetical protein
MQIRSVMIIPTTGQRMDDAQTILRRACTPEADNDRCVDYMHQEWLCIQDASVTVRPLAMRLPNQARLQEIYCDAVAGPDTYSPTGTPALRSHEAPPASDDDDEPGQCPHPQ